MVVYTAATKIIEKQDVLRRNDERSKGGNKHMIVSCSDDTR